MGPLLLHVERLMRDATSVRQQPQLASNSLPVAVRLCVRGKQRRV
jgi:hypothetical protein